MKGTVTTWQGNRDCGWITGEDGFEYFTHVSELQNGKKLRKGNKVRFGILDDGKENLRAVNVYKTGHGKVHPFANDLRDACQKLESGDFDPVHIESVIKKLRTIERYFCEVEDYEKYPNVVDTFRVKDSN